MAKVLIVDDSDAECRMLAAFIQAEHEVILGSDGIDAVWHYKRSKPDAVLLDVNMPIMSGLEALRRIKSIDPKARVAILTGDRGEEAVLAARTAGASDFVGKPYTSTRIAATIEVLFGRAPIEDFLPLLPPESDPHRL